MAEDDRIARVTERAASVFGDMGRAGEWMKTPNKALNGQSPLSMLDTDKGLETVMDILGRIDHGIFS